MAAAAGLQTCQVRLQVAASGYCSAGWGIPGECVLLGLSVSIVDFLSPSHVLANLFLN